MDSTIGTNSRKVISFKMPKSTQLCGHWKNTHSSSISARFKSYLRRWSYRKWRDRKRHWPDPEMITWPQRVFPLGAHVHNRELRNIRPSTAYSPVVTLVTWHGRRFPCVRACATRSWSFPPFYGCFRICRVVLHVRIPFFFFFFFFFFFQKRENEMFL